MENTRNEKGVTLIEVLISIVLLSIIFLSFMRFFPQMGFMNNENIDKTQAINTAKEILIEWQNSPNVTDNLKKGTVSVIPGYYKTDSTFYYFKTVKGNYDVNIKIKINSDLVSTPIKTRLIQIELLNKRKNIISETNGYIIS